MRKSLLLLMLCAALGHFAEASAQFIQQRFLPQNGERGLLGPAQGYPDVAIGNRLYRLAPGARVMDEMNRTLVHAQIPENREILFLRDQAGDVLRIYVLTDQEIASLPQRGWW